MSDDVQSVETTDQGSNANGLYDLDSVDPSIREALEPHLKAIEANATKKFQEAADYRKQWAPYEELGVQNVDPTILEQLFTFSQIANDPDQFANWWQEVGNAQGLFERFAPEDDLNLEPEEELTPERIQAMVAEAVEQTVSPIQEQLQSQQTERLESEANQVVDDAVAALREEDPNLTDEGLEVVLKLAAAATAGDPNAQIDVAGTLQAAHKEYMSIRGEGERGLFDQKSNQPQTPETTGTPSTGTEKLTSFDDPRLREQALERLRQSQ